MMALPRSATKALGRWPWKHHDVLDTREGKDRGVFKAGFAPEEPKAESQPIEHEATAPIVRTPSKLVKKRDAKAKDDPADEKGDDERPVTPSPDSATAEHVIVPYEPVPRPPTPKHNVLVKKNSLSKRAAAKAAEQDAPLKADGPDAVPEPLSVVANDSKEVENTADIPETPQPAGDPPSSIERETPAVPDTPAPLSPSPSSSHVHPFPVRGVTPPNGTRFIEGTDGSLEPTESRTTGTTNPQPRHPRPPRPQRRISLRSFGFFYGKDNRSAGAFPAYVPPSERVVYEVGDEDEASVHRPAPTHKRTNSRLPIGLLSPRKPASPKVTKNDKRAVASALSLRTLIIGPAAMESKDKAKRVDPKASAASALRKVNQQLLMPTEANRVIAALRDLPPPDLPPAAAQTVETVRQKKGWVFGRGGTRDESDRQETPKGSTGTVAMPIHGCCLDITDEEAEGKHFSKLTGSAFAPGSAVGTELVANTASADLSSLIPMLKDLRLVNLQASPDLSSVNAASLNAQLNVPDLGFGQSADRDGPLAGSVPSAGSLVDGMEKVGQTLMSLGFATTAAVLPSHVGIHPPKDRMSVLTYWWGYEVVLPPPTMRYLGHVKSISGALLNFLTAFSLFSNGVREMLPFIRYIAQFIEFEWDAIKAQDKGRGVVCAATWVMPAALVPRPWDFVDPPMNDRMARSMTPGPASMQPVTSAGLAPQASTVDFTGPATEPGETSVDDAFNAEVRDEAPMVPLVRHIEEDEQRQIETDNATTEIKDATTPVLRRSEDRDTRDT